MLFRESGTSNPLNLGNGFLVDDLHVVVQEARAITAIIATATRH